MTAPGDIDADGWRMPKKPRAIEVYHLAKRGFKPREIAKLTGLKPESIKVMTHHMRNPKSTPYGYFYDREPKTSKRQHDFTGKHTGRQRQYIPVQERERMAYNGARYDERSGL